MNNFQHVFELGCRLDMSAMESPSKIAGIYGVVIDNSVEYVGSSSDIKRRLTGHASRLRSLTHANKMLLLKYVERSSSCQLVVFHTMEISESYAGMHELYTVEAVFIAKYSPFCNTNKMKFRRESINLDQVAREVGLNLELTLQPRKQPQDPKNSENPRNTVKT